MAAIGLPQLFVARGYDKGLAEWLASPVSGLIAEPASRDNIVRSITSPVTPRHDVLRSAPQKLSLTWRDAILVNK